MKFLASCSYSVVELCTFLLVFICNNNFAHTNTTCTNRFNYICDRTMDISDRKHYSDFCMAERWIPLLFSKKYRMTGRRRCEAKRKFECSHNIRLRRFNTPFRASIKRINIRLLFFFYLGLTFTNNRTVGGKAGHFFNSSLPLPLPSQTLLH